MKNITHTNECKTVVLDKCGADILQELFVCTM